MNPSEKHILEIDSVELSFGDRRILSGVYLAVETGGVTAVLGRNGCGKSCLMKILCGSLRADFRSMRIDGKVDKKVERKEDKKADRKDLQKGLSKESRRKT